MEIDLSKLSSDELRDLRHKVYRETNKRRGPGAWACMDCGEDAMGLFMLRNKVWESLNLPNNDGILCIHCCAKRLGRRIVAEDLRPGGVNDVLFYLTEK